MQIIKNKKFQAEINETGAELTHLINVDADFDYIWNNEIWPKHAPVLFPAIGRSEEDSYLLDGKTYEMPQHGFAADQVFTVSAKTEDSISLSLKANDETRVFYPFDFELTVTFKLTETGLDVSFDIKNNDNKELGFSIGSHPAFNLPINGEGAFEDYKLEFTPANVDLKQFEIVKKPAPYRNGKVVPLKAAHKNTIDLNYDMFEDGLVIIENDGIENIKISSEKSKHALEISLDEFRYVCLWTKEGAKAPYLCVEPFQGLPDITGKKSELLAKEANVNLAPKSSREFSYSIALS